METKKVFANKELGFLLGLVGAIVASLLLAMAIWQIQIKTASAVCSATNCGGCTQAECGSVPGSACYWSGNTTIGFACAPNSSGYVKYCDPNAVGTNVMVGCVWEDLNGNGSRDSGDRLIGPARQNSVYVQSSPSKMVHYQALGWWGFSFHHYGCCGGYPLDACLPNSCDLIGSHPLAVSGVTRWGFQDNIPKSVGVWKGNFAFDSATYFFRLYGDFPHPRRLYIDDQLKTSTGGFIEQNMTAGTHKITVEYSQDNDASLGFTIFKMQPTFTVTPATASVAAGQTASFTANFDPDGTSTYDNPHYVSRAAQNVTTTATWTSSNPAVAAVSAAGQIRGVSSGTVTITATYSGKSDTSQLTVTGGATPDTTAPNVSITSPTAGATVSGTVNVTANATDNIAVTGVQFKVDGANIGAQDTTAPYSVSWNTATYSNGSHSITAVARDAAGNTKTSTAVAVTVNNANPPACSTSNCSACTQSNCPSGACTWNGSACVTASGNPPPAECTNLTGYASNCTSTGTKILRLTQSALSQTNIVVSVNLPATPVGIIYNTGYYYSPTRQQWVSFTLSGTPYLNSTAWLASSASANLNIPRTDLRTGTNYIITWDYVKNSTCWAGPEGACGTGKWRVATFNVQ